MRIKNFFKNLEKKENELLDTLDSNYVNKRKVSTILFIFTFIVLVFIKYIIRFGKLIFPSDKNEFEDIRY
ncbi:hypothetical protein N8719_02240 [Flavobacteriaceae bacterium]|nr:hypothetical protein [Flavobacteriaceae bacterium]